MSDCAFYFLFLFLQTPSKKVLPRAMITAIFTVILVYVLVTLGLAMIVGAGTIIEKEGVAIAAVGQVALD